MSLPLPVFVALVFKTELITPVPVVKQTVNRFFFNPQHNPETSVHGNTDREGCGNRWPPELSF